MAVQTLYRAGAFGPGSELWIIPDLNESSWARSIDWYLNFQLSKAKLHKSPAISDQLKEIVSQMDATLELQAPQSPNVIPLLVASESRLPNREVVELPSTQDIVEWLNMAYTTWNNLGCPTIRIFLPEGVEANDFSRHWPGDVKQAEITLVPHQANQ